MLVITHESHLDHAISTKQLDWILESFKNASGFSLTTLELPQEMGTVPCGLHGPAMGDVPVPEREVFYKTRGSRTTKSRMCSRLVRQTRMLTVIVGPDEAGHDCVLYTTYGGPQAPREPSDPGIKTDSERKEAEDFWSEHALSDE